MAAPLTRFVREIAAAHLAALSDGQLLRRFVNQRDEAAFTALVRRHGPLVLGACRRVLRDWHAAEDAFQTTFLVLALRATSIRDPETLGPWLYGVATRTARKARTKETRRCVRERRASVPQTTASDCLDWENLRPVLNEAVARLPEKYRMAFVLHHLQGLTVAEVARRQACPQGTVAARLARAKERLRDRLVRQGLVLSAAALSTALARGTATASVPVPLITGTVEAALGLAAAKAAGTLFAAAATFTRGGLQVMSSSKVSIALAWLVVTAVVGAGVWQQAGSQSANEPGGRQVVRRAPVNEKFYAGGFRTTRGFPFKGVGNSNQDTGATEKHSQDVLTHAKESPTGSWLFGLGVNSDAGLVGGIVLNERNFDLYQHKTFRGAGRELRLEVLPGTQAQRYTATFREPFLFDPASRQGINSDAGLVGDVLLNERDFDMRRSGHEVPKCQGANEADYQVQAGFGLRIQVPALGPVPVELDFGFPVVRDQQNSEQVFGFWLGFFT
jgi:RNA polymerase sigma factor (sigma-70 family)